MDHTPQFYVSPCKYIFDVKSVTAVRIKGIDDKRQITATFTISISEEFIPIQVIYKGKTTRYLLSYAFPKNFDITFSENHWSNTEKAIRFFKKVVFPCLKNVRQSKVYQNGQMSPVIMDTFKGQDNEEVAKICRENSCVLIIVPHNLTNKF